MADWGTGTEVWGPPNALLWGTLTPGLSPDQEVLVPTSILDAPTLRQSLQQLSQHLPEGRAWGDKVVEGTNTFALLNSCAVAFNRVQIQIQKIADEFDISMTTDLLPEWEKSVGLPDECVNTLASLAERRENIIFRLRRVPTVTKAEFEVLGTALAGVPVTVTPGAEFEGFPADSVSKFKLYVTFPVSNTGFPYAFPHPLGGFQSAVVECIFNKIVPANVVVVLA